VDEESSEGRVKEGMVVVNFVLYGSRLELAFNGIRQVMYRCIINTSTSEGSQLFPNS